MTSAIVVCWSYCDQELPSRPWLTVNKEVQRLAAPFGIGRSLWLPRQEYAAKAHQRPVGQTPTGIKSRQFC
jgi:hypothetical protein